MSKMTMFEDKPPRDWTGIEALSFEDDSRLRDLVAMLPAKRAGDDEIAAYLVELRAHFQRWLHQDEFGPTRGRQTKALRALMKSLTILQRRLIKGTSELKGRFEATLRSRTDPSSTVIEALYEAAVDVERDLRMVVAPKHQIMWASRLRDCVYLLMGQSQTLDTNTDGEIFLTAVQRKFDPLQVTAVDFGLADAERWLDSYSTVVFEALSDLNGRGGAEERVSLKLLIEQLCELWKSETQTPVTANGRIKDQYTGRTETEAGRFVTAAVEAMLPAQSWFDERAKFSGTFRAKTFLPGRQKDRERQILVIMRHFVNRRSKIEIGAAA